MSGDAFRSFMAQARAARAASVAAAHETFIGVSQGPQLDALRRVRSGLPVTKEQRRSVSHLNAALRQGARQERLTFRGVKPQDEAFGLKVGDTYELKAPISSTRRRSVAFKYGTYNNNDPTILVFNRPNGKRPNYAPSRAFESRDVETTLLSGQRFRVAREETRTVPVRFGGKVQRFAARHLFMEHLGKVDAMQKRRDERKGWQNTKDAAYAVGAAGATVKLTRAGAERVLGAQRFVHGAGSKAVNSILRTGLDPRQGGRAQGGSQAIGNPNYVLNSIGHVHVAKDNVLGRRLVSSPHGSLGQAQENALRTGRPMQPAQAMKHYLSGMVASVPHRNRVGGAMPYEQFKSMMLPDRDHVPGQAFKTPNMIGPENLRRSRAGLKQIWNARSKDIPGYIKANRGRFGRGVVALAGAGIAANEARRAVGRMRGVEKMDGMRFRADYEKLEKGVYMTNYGRVFRNVTPSSEQRLLRYAQAQPNAGRWRKIEMRPKRLWADKSRPEYAEISVGTKNRNSRAVYSSKPWPYQEKMFAAAEKNYNPDAKTMRRNPHVFLDKLRNAVSQAKKNAPGVEKMAKFQESQVKRDEKGRFADVPGKGDDARFRGGAPSFRQASWSGMDNGPRRTKAGLLQSYYGRGIKTDDSNVKLFERKLAALETHIDGLKGTIAADDVEGRLKLRAMEDKRDALAQQLQASIKEPSEAETSPRKFRHNVPKAIGEQKHMELIRRSAALINDGRKGAFEKATERRLLPKDGDGRTAARAYRHAATLAMEDVGLVEYDFGPMTGPEKAAFKPYVPFMRYVRRRVWQDLNGNMKGEFAPHREEYGKPFFRTERDPLTGEKKKVQATDPRTGEPRKTTKRNFEFIKTVMVRHPDEIDDLIDAHELRKADGIASEILRAL